MPNSQTNFGVMLKQDSDWMVQFHNLGRYSHAMLKFVYDIGSWMLLTKVRFTSISDLNKSHHGWEWAL